MIRVGEWMIIALLSAILSVLSFELIGDSLLGILMILAAGWALLGGTVEYWMSRSRSSVDGGVR